MIEVLGETWAALAEGVARHGLMAAGVAGVLVLWCL